MKKNEMRNEQFLQNYSASQFRTALSGKETNTFTITEDMRNKLWWIDLFNTAIEDLKNGNYINGCAEKNSAGYWLVQLQLLFDFEPKH